MKYEVRADMVTGLGNKKYRKGDVVTDAQFPGGNAKALQDAGHLVMVGKPSIEMIKQTPDKFGKKAYKDITVRELLIELGDSDENGNLKKSELYALYLDK